MFKHSYSNSSYSANYPKVTAVAINKQPVKSPLYDTNIVRDTFPGIQQIYNLKHVEKQVDTVNYN